MKKIIVLLWCLLIPCASHAETVKDIDSINGNSMSSDITSRPPIAQSNQAEKSPAQIFKDVSPAVVVITMSSVGEIPAGYGSGFIISQDGIIMTCLHCVSMAQNISISTKDGQRLPVTGIIGFDPINDICLLKVEAQGLPGVSLGNADILETGASIFTIGAPQNLSDSISDGLVSGKRQLFSRKMLQISAPISPGNSGGPVIDAYGNVVGVASFYHKRGQNLNFATPIDNNLKNFIQGSIDKMGKRDRKGLLDKFKDSVEYIKMANQHQEQWEYNHPNVSDCALGR